jgi:tRNA pseudouridine38-40 synthase
MPPSERLYTLHVPGPLDFQKIETCFDILVGTHDFSSFENAGSRDKSVTSGKGAVRTISSARLEQYDQHKYAFSFIGEGFLRHMVRNIVGTLLEVGRGQRTENEFRYALEAKDRCAGGATAPAHGLTLKRVLY